MRKHICDFCKGKESDAYKDGSGEPKGWKTIKCEVYFSRQYWWDACPECAKKLGIEQETTPGAGERILDALIDLMKDVAEEEMGN